MSNRTYRTPPTWLDEKSFHEPQAYFDELLKDIEQAKECIFLESYIFNFDTLGKQVLKKLSASASNGVKVKLLVDGIGSIFDVTQLSNYCDQHHIEFKVYHPSPLSFSIYTKALKKGLFLNKFFYFLSRINARDHRKLCIIDNQIAWTGSFNISLSHLPYDKGGDNWQDHGLRVTGHNVIFLSKEFLDLWHAHHRKKLGLALPIVLSSLNPLKRHIKTKRIKQLIEGAQQRIWIANAYFAPHRSILSALKKAKKNGADVRILVGKRSDIKFFPNLTRSFYSDLLNHDIRIYEWQDNILHSKILLLDNTCISGSSNLNSRSYYHDLELDIVVRQVETILNIENKFLSNFDESEEITKRSHFKNRAYILAASLLPRILRYWL